MISSLNDINFINVLYKESQIFSINCSWPKYKINFLFEKIDQNKKIKSIILKRVISLIKAWCHHEGNSIGPNVSLTTSCAPELITSNIFNTNYQNIKTELNSINEINFDKIIIILFEPINKGHYFNNKNKNDLFCYIENKNQKKEYLFNIEDINDNKWYNYKIK